MAFRLAALPILALLFGAVDTLLVRREFDHRPPSLELFWQSSLLWLALGVLVLPPALLWRAWRGRKRGPSEAAPAASSEVASQAAWMLGPVLLHMSLDRHTGLGGNLSGLLSAGAIADIALTVLALFFLVKGARALLAKLGAGKVGAALGAIALLAGSFVHFHEEVGGGSEVPSASGAATGERSNVLLMIWDTSRAKSLNFYGYARETTPHLAELSESSVFFKFARSVSSYTLTSHLSMLTGVYPSDHGARLLRQVYDPGRTPSVAGHFRDHGFRTGAFVGTSVLTANTGTIWGFETYDDLVDPPVCDTHAWALVHDVQAVLAKKIPALANNGRPHWFQDFQRPASDVLANAAAWIERPDPRPWFCMVNMYDVHWPYLPADESREKWVAPYDGVVTGFLTRDDDWEEDVLLTDVDREHAKHLYDAEMWELDRRVNAFLEGIDLDETALIITSDHGEAFGEAGHWEHNHILESQLRVPLLVRPAGGVEGREDRTPASGVDIAPTALDLGGILDAVVAEREAQGAELARFLGHSLLRPLPERDVLVEDRDHPEWSDVRIALYHDHWKLVRSGIGEEVEYALFDLDPDRNGIRDVIDLHPEVAADLEQRLEALRATWGADDEEDLRGGGFGNLDALEALGYMGAEEAGGGAPPGP